MKKIISVLGIVVMIGIFAVGCGDDDGFDWPWAEDAEDAVDSDDDADVDADDEKPVVTPLEDEDQLISFNDEPVLVDYEQFFVGAKRDLLLKYVYADAAGNFDNLEEWQIVKMYEVGTFAQGDYKGQKMYLLEMPCEGMCFGLPHHRMTINPDGTWTMFSRYSDEWGDYFVEYYGQLFEHYDNLLIEQYEYPPTVVDEETGTVFEIMTEDPNVMISEVNKYKIFENDKVGSVYTSRDDECSFVALPDGQAQQYDMVVDFSTGVDNYESYDVEYMGASAGEVFDITWSDGTKEEGLYSYKSPYRFFGPCVYVKNSEYPMNMFVEGGVTGKGDPIYVFAWDSAPALKDFYDMAFPEYMDESMEKLSYEEFLAKRPLFYWKDPYDRLLEFGKTEFQPMTEIGKPVIYLYPEADTVVHVEVEPTHGISVSDPEYGRDGWTVLARPSGELRNFADGLVYPYLFWEGLSLDYEMPEEGFVVARREVEGFLESKLAELGMVDGEIADFMEFWYPKFNSAPYYFVTFMPQADFEEIAPLSVVPEPDTVIRVYMDYAPLRRPIDVVEPEFVTPERNGFTVVEWGGALHR